MLTLLHLSDLHITTTDADTQFDRDVEIRSYKSNRCQQSSKNDPLMTIEI